MSQSSDISLTERIKQLRDQRQAVILAHNYQRDDVQDIADFVGDSLELSQQAARTDARVIVFCGVHFMAETASIICPDKTVLLPDANAGCPMANMITAAALRDKKKELPGIPVVCYINSTAEVKAESDICCTSANGVRVVDSLKVPEIIFVPDQYLGSYIASKTKVKVNLWPGFCPTHMRITSDEIIALKKQHPKAAVVVHPECRPDVIAVADQALSTSGIIRFARETDKQEIIIGTEIGIIHRLQKDSPEKVFIAASKKAVCPNMKLITVEKVLWALEDMAPVVTVPEEIRVKAKRAVDRMLAVP